VKRATSVTFGLHAGKIKFNKHNEQCVSERIIIRTVLPSIYLRTMSNTNILIITEKLLKMQLTT
jgi:hypothetical protein